MKKKCRGIDDFLRMSKEDAKGMYARATGEAVAQTHAAGLPTCHASDKEGYRMCFLFPDGHREYFNTPEEGNAILGRHGLT